MGQSNESTLGNEEELTKVFRVESRVKEQNLTYLEHKITQKQYVLRQTAFKEESEMLQRLAQLKSRQDLKNPHLTNLIKIEHEKHEDLCSKYYTIYTLWEFPKRTLAQDINERALSKKPYQHQEIKQLMKQIAEGCLALQQYRVTHECLTSKTVLVENSMTYRVVDPLALPIHPNLDVIYHKRNIKNIYLSPEQCRIIDQQDIKKPVFDPYREDVFTGGMLIMEAGLLNRQDDCYEDDCSRINWKQIQSHLTIFQNMFGPELRRYLGMMLTPETSQRIDWLQLLKLLGEETPKTKTQYIHRVSAVQPPPIQTRIVTVQRPMRKSLMFSYKNPSIIRSSISPNHQKTPVQVYPIRPVSQLVQNSQPTQYSVIVHEPKKEMFFTNIKTSKAFPVRFLHNQSNVSPSNKSPQQFKGDKEEMIYSVDEFKNGGKYEGYKLNGKREGFGIYTYQEGGRYEGEWKNDLMCGKGKLFYQSGKIAYDGELQNDLFHGIGTLYNENPEHLHTSFNYQNFEDIDEYWVSYEGQFREDKKEGKGLLLLTNGEVLEGTFHDDKVEGPGCFVGLNGEKIRGVWHENKFQRELP